MDKRFIRLSRDNKIEVTMGNKVGVLDEMKKRIVYDDGTEELILDMEVLSYISYRKELRAELVDYYNSLLNGDEKLFLIKVEGEDISHIITSRTLLERGHESLKYLEVFESVFYPSSLEKMGISGEIGGVRDIEEKISGIPLGESKMVKIRLDDLVNSIVN